MKKVLVLVMVLAMASAASALPSETLPWTDGNVTWSIHTGRLLGTGNSLGAYDVFLTYSLVTPHTANSVSPGTDGDEPGVYAIAGNQGKMTNFGDVVWNARAEDLVVLPDAPAEQVVGLWFALEILEAGTLTFYSDPETVLHTMEIPEPATMGLLSLGGLALLRRRRKK